MESEPGYIERRISEITKEIDYTQNCIERFNPTVTSEWGSGTYKKRKNRAYSANGAMRKSEFEGRLETLKEQLNNFNKRKALLTLD